MKRWLLLGGIVVVVTAAVVFVASAFMGGGGAIDTAEDGTAYVCQNPACKNEFTLTGEQISQHHRDHYGAPLPCPKCGKPDIAPATRCPTCKRLYAQERTA